MNTLPDVIYIQLGPSGTPGDEHSRLEGSTHNAERINDDDVKYVRAGAAMDRVQAMALFVDYYYRGTYNVPDIGLMCNVHHRGGSNFSCNCPRDKCDHIKAVKIYLEQSEGK